MNASKIIKGVVGGGRYTVTAPIVKEDYGLYLQIDGIELPETYEVDFSNDENSGTSVTMIGNADGVLIPSQFISSGKDVFAFLYHVGADFGRTVYKFRIPNKLRPDRTDEAPTPEEQSVIDQTIAALNDAVEQTAQDVISADASAQSAESAKTAAESARDTAQTYANNAQTSATQASTSASQASASATASANSASASAQIKADVEELVDDAQGYAESASQSATASANSATTAQGYAQSASASAQSASGYASNAQSSAQTASSKASEASQSASQASGYAQTAETAKTDAQTAKTQAETARDNAVTAKTAAVTAQGKAEDAQAAAESVAESIPSDYSQLSEDVGDLKEDLSAMPSVKESNETESDLDISDSQGNVILRLANGHIQTKYFNSDTTGNVITVAPSGADYTTIRGAVEAAASAGASETNPYAIQIASGSYDILSEFTSAEIAGNDFIGLVVTNGITLKGMGITRDEVLLHADMDTSYESAKRNKVATINLHGNVGLENLTVKATHMRYAVHDDTGYGNGSTPTTRIIRNCRFIALNTTSGGYGRISYGAGTDGSKTFVFEDCDFTDLVHIHTSTHAYSNVVWMFNCRGYGFTAADYASGADNHYHIYGGDFKWINVVKGSNWTSQHLFIDGDIKDAFIGGWSGMQYELGDCSKHQPTALTSFPVGVAMAQSGNYRDKKATGADDCIGVCVYCDSTNNYALVQYRGWLCAEVLGLENATIGQYLVVGSNGALSLSDSDAESIGKVVCSNPAGQHFIKLSI